jgi:hypothetical protein
MQQKYENNAEQLSSNCLFDNMKHPVDINYILK